MGPAPFSLSMCLHLHMRATGKYVNKVKWTNMQEGLVSWELRYCVLYSGLNYWHLSVV